jgi:hypothetical protein
LVRDRIAVARVRRSTRSDSTNPSLRLGVEVRRPARVASAAAGNVGPVGLK